MFTKFNDLASLLEHFCLSNIKINSCVRDSSSVNFVPKLQHSYYQCSFDEMVKASIGDNCVSISVNLGRFEYNLVRPNIYGGDSLIICDSPCN